MGFLRINLKRSLTRIEAEEAIVAAIPDLRGVELSILPDGTDGSWWFGTGWKNPDLEHDWSGYVHPDGRVEGPY